jgi:hypothetical protein
VLAVDYGQPCPQILDLYNNFISGANVKNDLPR